MKYKVVGSGRESGIDVAVEVEASSSAEAEAKANKLGILVSGSAAPVPATAASPATRSTGPVLIVSLCANVALVGIVAWTNLRQPAPPKELPAQNVLATPVKPSALTSQAVDGVEEPQRPSYEGNDKVAKRAPAVQQELPAVQRAAGPLQELREELGPPSNVITVKYDEFKNRSTFESGRFEITLPHDGDKAIFMQLSLYGEGRTAKALLENGMYFASFVCHSREPVPFRENVNWIVDGVRFEGKEEEDISRIGRSVGGYATHSTTTVVHQGLRKALEKAQSVKVQVMGFACELDEQSVQRVRKYFSDVQKQ